MKKLDSPVILYQMGKVGSSTLRKSLNNISIPTLHIHRYFFGSYETKNRSFRALLVKIKQRILFDYYLKDKNVKIITLFRDPLTRNISSFFQNLETHFRKNQLKTLTFEMLRDKFNSLERIHKTPESWFDLEFFRKTNINIFNFSFEKEKGYITIQKDNISCFICTLERLNFLENQVRDFIDNKEFKLIATNKSDNKWYAALYNEFKMNYIPETEMFHNLYDSKTTRYFYDSATISKFRDKWNLDSK